MSKTDALFSIDVAHLCLLTSLCTLLRMKQAHGSQHKLKNVELWLSVISRVEYLKLSDV
jgi:hypothetical protein